MVIPLRIIASHLCFALCVAFIACWVRSHDFWDWSSGVVPGKQDFYIRYVHGVYQLMWISSNDAPDPYLFDRFSELHDAQLEMLHSARQPFWAFSASVGKLVWQIVVPNWFPVVISGAIAILFKPTPRSQFSLRGLLILTTVVALVLGGIAGVVSTVE